MQTFHVHAGTVNRADAMRGPPIQLIQWKPIVRF
jgi:hypothetical protein